MQVVNKKMCVIVILVLVIIESCTLFLMYKSYGNKNTNLDEVNLNINDTNMFAIMLEQEDGTYKEDTTSTWPTRGYTYNADMSGCIDINGNRLEDALTYDKENNKASVNTTNTSYCYLYFSIKQIAAEYLLKNPTDGLVTTSLQGGLYRYQGTDNVDNYICFGTRDKDTCVNNTNRYMFRIIGIDENNKLKLISKETLEYVASSECASGRDIISEVWIDLIWPQSTMYKSLNGLSEDEYYTNIFVNNNLYSYMTTDSEWYNIIENVDWKYGETGFNYHAWNYNGPSVYEVESGFTNTINAKIGLMNVSDYYFAYPSGIPGNYSNAEKSWIHINNNDDEIPYCHTGTPWELLLTYVGYGDFDGSTMDMHFYWTISPYGTMDAYNNYMEAFMRPVFYLTSDAEIIGGTGTSTDPFLIN